MFPVGDSSNGPATRRTRSEIRTTGPSPNGISARPAVGDTLPSRVVIDSGVSPSGASGPGVFRSGKLSIPPSLVRNDTAR